MPYQFDVEKFNAGDEQQFALFYSLRHTTVIIYAKYKTHDKEKAWVYTNMAFQQLKKLNPKNFSSIRHITKWLKHTVENCCLVYDSGKSIEATDSDD